MNHLIKSVSSMCSFKRFLPLSILFSAFAYSESVKNIDITEQIQGSKPIITSLGTRFAEENIISSLVISRPEGAPPPVIENYTVIKQVKDGREYLIPTVNSIIEIPMNELNHSLFKAYDLDEDNDLSQSDIQWYIVEIKNPNKEWPKDFTNASEVKEKSVLMIDEEDVNLTPIESLEDEPHKVKIPIEALNKRIGFSITPKSTTGFPHEGEKIFMLDLNYTKGQKYDGSRSPSNVIPATVLENNFNSGGGRSFYNQGVIQ